MENHDPRNPIIKATDDEGDEVEGHRLIDNADSPNERILRATDAAGEDDEVEGHRFIDNADSPNERILRATDAAGEDDEVEGHRPIDKVEGPDERRTPKGTE